MKHCVETDTRCTNIPLQYLSFPGPQRQHTGTQESSWSRSYWDKLSKPFQSTALHSLCPVYTRTSVPGQRRAAQMWRRQTELPGNNTEKPDRSPPTKKEKQQLETKCNHASKERRK